MKLAPLEEDYFSSILISFEDQQFFHLNLCAEHIILKLLRP